MSLKRPTIVIFDMDGTSVRHLNPKILHILEKMDDASYRVTKFFDWVFMRGAKGPILPEDEMEERSKKMPRLLVHRALHKIRRKPVEQIVEPCPGIFRFLRVLKDNNIPTAIVSNGLGKGYGHDIMDKFGFWPYFRAAIFREDIHKSKPHPESLLLALKSMEIEPATDDVIWYIGDRHKDVTASLAAGKILPALVQPVAYGVNAAAAVLEKGVGPDHIIMSYYDMHSRFCQLKKKEDEQSASKDKTASADNTLMKDIKALIKSVTGGNNR